MHIKNISADVRTVAYGAPSYQYQLEQRIDGQWTTVWSTNEMSNDWAYSEMRDRAHALADQLRRVVA